MRPSFEEILRFTRGLEKRLSDLAVLFFSLSQFTCTELQPKRRLSVSETENFTGVRLLMETKNLGIFQAGLKVLALLALKK